MFSIQPKITRKEKTKENVTHIQGEKAINRNRPQDEPEVANSTKGFKAPSMNMFKDLKEKIYIMKDRKS